MPRQRTGDDNNVLRAFRTLRNLTQEEAAKRMGVSRTLWSAWEGRSRPMTLAHLNKAQEILRLSEDQILEIIDWWGFSCFEELPSSEAA